jgi:hypothetical protein
MDEFLGSQISYIRLIFFMCSNTFTQSICKIRTNQGNNLRLESPSSTSAVLLRRLVAFGSVIGVIASTSSTDGASTFRL